MGINLNGVDCEGFFPLLLCYACADRTAVAAEQIGSCSEVKHLDIWRKQEIFCLKMERQAAI